MQYLGLALYAEGPTDYYFLSPLLLRLCEDICTTESPHVVEFSEVLALNHRPSSVNASREQRIFEAAKDARGAWKILFVHADGDGDSARARDERAQPTLDLLHQQLVGEGAGVAVIPIRETEAWAIHDGDTLRQVFGTTLTNEQLGLPAIGNAVEGAPDPKGTLGAAFQKTRPSGRRKRQGVAPMLHALGEQVSLQRLRQLTGFLTLEIELKQALRQLHIVE